MINPIGYLTPSGVFQLNCEVKNSFEWGKQFIPLYTYSQKELIQQQAQEIEKLKEDLHNKIISSARRILILEEKLEDCTCQGGHSKAYLKAKGKL